jgi:hypothetical protein
MHIYAQTKLNAACANVVTAILYNNCTQQLIDNVNAITRDMSKVVEIMHNSMKYYEKLSPIFLEIHKIALENNIVKQCHAHLIRINALHAVCYSSNTPDITIAKRKLSDARFAVFTLYSTLAKS